MSDDIEIVDYDQSWPQTFDHERDVLLDNLPNTESVRIVHFGSTAVPGLRAKPIIDIMVIVPDLSAARALYPDRLKQIDYVFWAENPKTDRLFFVKGMPPYGERRTHHVHVVEPDGEMVRQLKFADHLRSHPDVATKYAALKDRLAQLHTHDREAYTQAKSDFIGAVMAELE